MRQIKFSPPSITQAEIDEVVDTLKSGWLTTGPKTKKLEQEIAKYCHTDKAVALNSATACLELTLRLLGIGPGDEIITSSYTYTASASVIDHVGADVVLVDTKKDSFFMDPKKIKEAITEKTKAIIPVDIGGVLCDYEEIYKIVEDKRAIFQPNSDIQKKFGRIIVVADAAHSFGSKRKSQPSGSFADFTCFSFHAVKNLTTAEGGAVVWKSQPFIDNEAFYRDYMYYSLHGQTKDALSKTNTNSWRYDIVAPLYKCNMTDIHASIGLAQLNRYEGILSRRREIVKKYNEAFSGERFMHLEHFEEEMISCCHLYLLRIHGMSEKQRDELIEYLSKKGVPTNVHYQPLPMLTAYKNLGFKIDDYPNAFEMYENEITLPVHTELSNEDLDYIINCVKVGVEKTCNY